MNARARPGGELDVLVPARMSVGECPLWCVAEQALYWVDIEGRALHRHDHRSGAHHHARFAERIGCIALTRQGACVFAAESGLYVVPSIARFLERWNGDETTEDAPWHRLLDARMPAEGMRFNDGRCDRHGRLWVSTMEMDMKSATGRGALRRIDAGLQMHEQFDGLLTGNGLAFSPDGRRMYLSDSHPRARVVWTMALDEAGIPVGQREGFIDMKAHPGRPDGAAVDREGAYWCCGNDAGLVHRFQPDGRLERSIRLPVSKPSMCAFGGPDMDHLFITSIRPSAPVAGFDATLDGAVFVLRTDCTGLPEPCFALEVAPVTGDCA